jgi:hypothetical protein
MTTTIDTAPSAGLVISDANTSDTITIADGPAENGFQTTQVTTATDTTIFANKTAVVIDGANKGDNVVFNNPDPAAGLQTLVVQNLGTGSTINGSNPNAQSPDVVASALNLQAYTSIGNTRALRTQVSTLQAAAGIGAAGNINISNGVATPVTLSIASLQATNAAGGTITLTNNGTINDATGGIFATGGVNITANGATADLNTGSGAGITSNTGAVGLTIGRDINLGDGVGTGSVSAATGINASAGGNITLNANAKVTNTTSGNLMLQAGGNITMLTSPGSLAGAPEIVDNASGGAIELFAGAGHTLTVDSTGTSAIVSNNGLIALLADAIVINKAINAGTARVDLTGASFGQAISLGAADGPGVIGLTQAELNRITAAVVQIGSPSTGNITVASPITALSGSNVLSLINNGSISQSAFGSLATPNLRVSSTGPVVLNNTGNNIQTIAVSAPNAVTVVDGAHALTVGTVDGTAGIATNNSAINLTADNLNIAQQVSAGTGIVTLAPYTATQQVVLGGADGAGTLGLSDAELGQVTASVLRVGPVGGSISIGGAVTRHAGYNTLSLSTGGSISQTAALSVANLALCAVGGIALTNSANTVDTLAFTAASGSVNFTNASANALTIGAVDGMSTSSSASTTTLSTGGNLTFAAGLSSVGTATLTSTSGAILDGDNGADVDVTAPTLALSASTGIGSAATPLHTEVGALNALTSTGGIFINNGNAAPVTLTLNTGGGGVRANGATGDIVLTNNGTIDIQHLNDLVLGSGNVTVKALGTGADLNTGGQTSALPIRSLGSGLVDVEAGRDITLGDSGFGDVRSDSGSIVVKAGRNITLNGDTFIDIGSGSGGITATAGGNFTMTAAAPDEIFTQSGSIALTTGAGGTLTLASSAANAVLANTGNITLTADAMAINKGVSAATGSVQLQPVTAGETIGLGTASGTLQLSNTELNLVTASTLTIGNANAGWVTLAGSVNPTHVTNLTIKTGSNFTASAGSTINVGAGTLTVDVGLNGLGGTADLSGAAITAGTINVNGGDGDDLLTAGAGNDTLNGGLGHNVAIFHSTEAQTVLTDNHDGTWTAVGPDGTDSLSNIEVARFSDGDVLLSQADIVGLYQSILGRTPAPVEVANWENFLANGGTLAQVRTDFATSAEAQGDITGLYQSIFGRTPAPVEVANWENFLANGGTLAQIRTDFATSGEAQGDIIWLYQTILDRTPAQVEVASWENFLANGGTLAQVRADIVNSPEGQGDAIVALYQEILGRTPSAGEIASWVALLNSGTSLAQVRADIVNSPEGQGDAIVALYQAILGRTPGAGEIASWVALLNSGTSLAQVRTDFATSGEAQSDITGFYQSMLGRTPAPVEVAGWENFLANVGTLAQVRTDFATSGEAQGDIIGLYQSILGRTPAPVEVANWENFLANGGTLAQVRTDFATGAEAQGDITGFYQNILGRTPAQAEVASWESLLANGATLAQVRTDFATGGEAQADITGFYQSMLGRTPAQVEVAGWENFLVNGGTLAQVRTDVATSAEAQADLTAIFQTVEGRGPDQAELAGLENQIGVPGASQASITAALINNGPSGFTEVVAPAGSASLSALAGPERFDFSTNAFGNDTIAGFNVSQAAIALSHAIAASFGAIQADSHAANGGTSITFNGSQSIMLDGVSPNSLVAANFHIV